MLARLLLAHAPAVRRFATSAPALRKAAEMMGWGVAHVVEFAQSEGVGLDDEDVEVLKKNKVDGESLLNLTEDKLRADGMPRGPATKLAAAIAKLPRPPRPPGEFSGWAQGLGGSCDFAPFAPSSSLTLSSRPPSLHR